MTKMLDFVSKLKFLFRRPKIVVVTGNGRQTAKEAIFQVLKSHFKVGEEILILETDLEDIEEIKFYLKNSSLPVLVVSHLGDVPPDKIFFAGERNEKIRALSKTIPAQSYLVLNFDDETVREIKDETNLQELTFGFQERADFKVTDIKLNGGTNFKINYKGNIVPVWLDKLFGKEQIYAALAAASCGNILGLNLVEVSQALKNYHSLPGKMRIIEGIKHSEILDDSQSATVFSMIEAIETLGAIPGFKRKIAVLGDIMGVGKYTVEAHEAVGERVAKKADLLFTFGLRAKFIAEAAQIKGMPIENIFQFDTIEEGKLKLQAEIREGDLILIDGSKEMEMEKIVEEIKKV